MTQEILDASLDREHVIPVQVSNAAPLPVNNGSKEFTIGSTSISFVSIGVLDFICMHAINNNIRKILRIMMGGRAQSCGKNTTIFIEFAFRRIMLFFKLLHCFIGDRPACRFNQPGINSNTFINSEPQLVELFKKNTVNLYHSFFGDTFSKTRKSRMIRRRELKWNIKKIHKGDSVVDLAFKLRVRFDLKPFLQQHAFKQKQRMIGSFTFV